VKRSLVCSSVLLVLLATLGCGPSSPPADRASSGPDLAGAWRARVQFQSGDFAAIKDLEFMYVFNAGGTMTESSNYDAAPPVPPAYGIWRRVGPDRFEAHYEFYATRAPATLEEITKGGGWLPSSRGVLTETITLASDGKSYTSKITYRAFDPAGQPRPGGGEAEGRGVRIEF
jgi:hypothetical protein